MPTKKRKKPEGSVSDGRSSVKGQYANYFRVGYNANDFIFDFGQVFSGNEEAELYTRIITSPVYAKIFSELLQDSISQYEDLFGPICEKECL